MLIFAPDISIFAEEISISAPDISYFGANMLISRPNMRISGLNILISTLSQGRYRGLGEEEGREREGPEGANRTDHHGNGAREPLERVDSPLEARGKRPYPNVKTLTGTPGGPGAFPTGDAGSGLDPDGK